MQNIRSYKELRVYQSAIDAAMRIFEITKTFPAEERYSMVDQMRRSSRSVCANIGELGVNAAIQLTLLAS
jgi:four helix bundle protein